MRPDRFEPFALDLLKNAPGTTRVTTLREAGDTKHPRGLAVSLGSAEARVQFTAQSAPGDRYEQPEHVIEGEPVQPDGDPVLPPGKPQPTDIEAWLAAVLAGSGSPEMAKVCRWSTREGARKGHVGVTAHFHSGARIFVRLM